MHIAAAMTYWVIVAVWLTVLATVAYFYVKNPRAFGTTRLLLAVLVIDTTRNLVENAYFGLFFGSQYGLLSARFAEVLGSPFLLIVPKLLNILAGCVVLSLLLLRWLPLAINERERTEHARHVAEEAARLKDEFTATVSHELRTPLTAMTASLSLLQEETAGALPAEARELIEIAAANSRRLRRLVDDILDIEKLEAGKLVFRFERVVLDTLLRQEVEASRSLAQSSAVTLRLDLTANVEIEIDPDRFKQVIANLISNAIKYSPPGKEVVLSTSILGERFAVAVRDHGPGIPAEFRSHVFEKFAQADMSSSRPKTGTGLGLSIVKEIVERLRGSVVFADAPGGGTVFTVELPVRQGSIDHAGPAPTAQPQRRVA